MAGKPRIQVTGAKELRRALKRMDNDASDLRGVNLDAAKIVAGRARDIVPRLSGTLENSIRALASKSSGSVAAGKARIPYAGVIHFGWPAHNIEPQPFLYDALDQRATQVVQLYEQRIAELVVRVGRES